MTFLTLLTIALISTLLYSPIPEQLLDPMKIATIATPTLLLILQMLNLGKNKTEPIPEVIEEIKKEEPPAAAAATITTEQNCDAAVVQFIARLQDKGRFLDFIMDDITAYDNESIGAAARIVHQGCCEVMHDSFTIETIFGGEEMEEITLADNYDSHLFRLVGNVPESAPFEGHVLHRGWKTTRVNLPQVVNTEEHIDIARSIMAPADVEIN